MKFNRILLFPTKPRGFYQLVKGCCTPFIPAEALKTKIALNAFLLVACRRILVDCIFWHEAFGVISTSLNSLTYVYISLVKIPAGHSHFAEKITERRPGVPDEYSGF